MEAKNKINKKLLVKLLIYLALGWFIFSVLGFWPKIISIPVPEKVQKYNSIFYLVGNSNVNRIIRGIDEKKIKVKAIVEMNIFSEETYEYDDLKFYFMSKHLFGTVATGKKFSYSIDLSERILDYTLTKISEEEMANLQEEKGIVYNCTLTQNNGRYQLETVKYKEITELLNKNETEKISIKDLMTVLCAVKNNILLGWYQDKQTAVFYNEFGESAYVSTYKLGDSKKISYGPLPINDELKNGSLEYVWNFVTELRGDK